MIGTMNSKEPKLVKRDVKVCTTSDFNGMLIMDIILELRGIEDDLSPSDFFNLRWYKSWRMDIYGYSDHDVIVGDRFETDKEYEQRMARKKKRAKSEAKRKATVLENKQKELDKLKEQVAKLQQQIGE